MTNRGDNPRWLAVLVTAIPVAAGTLWAWWAPPAPASAPAARSAPAVRPVDAVPERLARVR